MLGETKADGIFILTSRILCYIRKIWVDSSIYVINMFPGPLECSGHCVRGFAYVFTVHFHTTLGGKYYAYFAADKTESQEV